LCSSKVSFSPRFNSIRYFNTTCSNSNKQSSKKSGIDNSDKKPDDENENMKSIITKLSMLLMFIYVVLIALKYQLEMYLNSEVSFFSTTFAIGIIFIRSIKYCNVYIACNFCLLE